MPSIGSTRIDETSPSGHGIVIYGNDTINVDISEQEIIDIDVTENKTWRIEYAEVVCSGYGRWKITIDGEIWGGGITEPGKGHDRSDLPSFVDVSSGKNIKVLYLYTHGPSSMPIDAFIGAIEF